MAFRTGIHGAITTLLLTTAPLVMAAPGVDPGLNYYTAQSVIEDTALHDARGAIGVNMAAGDQNAQINARALAVSSGQGVASATTQVQQHVQFNATTPDDTVSRISGQALAGSRGLVSVNQTSGVGNAQANAIAIGLAMSGLAVSENELSLSVSGQGQTENTPASTQTRREASIGAEAFGDSKGVVQINQLAGSGNATSNTFGLSVSLGATP